MKKTIALLTFLLSLVLCGGILAACAEQEIPEEPAPVFTLDVTSLEISAGSAEVLTLTSENVDESPVWTSTNPTVASVTVSTNAANKATVRGISAGTAVIAVTAGDNIAVCAVTVTEGPYVTVVNKTMSLLAGRTGRIEVETNVEGALTYTSDKTNVATVNAEGLVTGISGGTARITVSGEGKSDVCTVTVTEPYVELDVTQLLLTLEGDTSSYQLTAESNGTVEWSSENPSIATVADGLVTAVSIGETTITARFGSASATCSVKVKEEILELALSEREVRIELGESYKLTATLTPEQSGEDAAIEWEVVEGEDIISVDTDGTVHSLGEYGMAIVRATSVKDPDAYDECVVTVPAPYSDWIAISDAASFIAAFTAGNEEKNMYLMTDIDLGGTAVTSTLTNYSGEFDGRGYTVSNFSCNSLFGTGDGIGLTSTGVVKNVAIICTLSGVSSHRGLFGQQVEGRIENCRLEITFGSSEWQGAIARNIGRDGTVKNTILLLNNPNNTPNVWAGTSQAGGTWENVYYTVYSGNVSNVGAPISQSEEQLKRASLYTGWDTSVWNIRDGEIPTLLNDGNFTVSISIDPATLISELKTGTTHQLRAIVNRGEVMWESSSNAIATVSESGLVTAVGEGSVTITATSVLDPTKSASITLEVKNQVDISISLSQNAITLDREDSATLTATVTGSNQGVRWTSSDSTVASVDEDGKITTYGKDGTATITATALEDDGSGNRVSASCTVTVAYIPVEFELDQERIELYVGGSLIVSEIAAVSKGGYTLSIVDGNGVVEIEDGVILALTEGTAIVRLTSTISYDDHPAETREIIITVAKSDVREIVLTGTRFYNDMYVELRMSVEDIEYLKSATSVVVNGSFSPTDWGKGFEVVGTAYINVRLSQSATTETTFLLEWYNGSTLIARCTCRL